MKFIKVKNENGYEWFLNLSSITSVSPHYKGCLSIMFNNGSTSIVMMEMDEFAEMLNEKLSK